MPSALAKRIESMQQIGGIKARDVAELLDTTPETVTRWRKGNVEPQPDRLQRLLTLEWLISELSEFYTPEEARLWLFAPHPLLKGKRPADRIREGGIDDVLAIIEQLKTSAIV